MNREEGLSPEYDQTAAMILEFPTSGTVGNKFVFISQPFCGILLKQPEQTKTGGDINVLKLDF